jgi:type IV fimbrial biogenesis protein FimT
MRTAACRTRSGFTVVELMVTLGVLAILIVAGIPSFLDYFDRSAVRGAADGVISLISDARAEAVKNDLNVNVAMTGSGSTWCVGANAALVASGGNPATNASACDCSDTSQCQVSGQRLVFAASDFPGVQAGTAFASITFDRQMGIIDSLDGRNLTLTSPRGKYDLRVEVSPLGQARLCFPAGKPSIVGVPRCRS